MPVAPRPHWQARSSQQRQNRKYLRVHVRGFPTECKLRLSSVFFLLIFFVSPYCFLIQAHGVDEIAKALLVACEALMIEDIEIITSVGGIGNTAASAFLAELGDYPLFASY